MNIKQLLEKLENFYWSPEHPSHYVLQLENGREKGVGLIAYQDFAAFNLAWGGNQGRANTENEHETIVSDFNRYKHYTSYVMGEQTVGDWVCMLKPNEFLARCKKTPVGSRAVHEELMDIAVKAMQYDVC